MPYVSSSLPPFSRVNAFDFGTAKRRRGTFSLYWDSNAFALRHSAVGITLLLDRWNWLRILSGFLACTAGWVNFIDSADRCDRFGGQHL